LEKELMRIAIISDDYLPDSTLVHAKMLHELALEMLNKGHQPIVVCPGSAIQTSALKIDNIDGVEIWRFKSGKTRGVGKLKRAINETLLSFNAWRAISSMVKDNLFDGVVYYSPSIFFGPLVRRIKKYSQCPSYLILRDSFPQWAVDEGLIKSGSLIEKYFRIFEKINYDSADSIGLMSPKNLDIFNKTSNNKYNSHVLYNWANHKPNKDQNEWIDVRERLDLHGKTIFFYGGNIGHAQDIDNLLRLALSMEKNSEAHFLFVGQGDEVELVQQHIAKRSTNNVSFLPSVSQEKFKHILSQVDVGLFSLAHSHKIHNFPGKLLGYMVDSLPILGSVNPGNDLIDVINESQAGYVYINGDDESLVSAGRKLASEQVLRSKIGRNSNRLLYKHFSVESAADTVITSLSLI